MVKRHLLRMSAPRTWQIKRKALNWVIRPNAGPHKMENCLPIGFVLKEMLGYAKTTTEAKKILEGKNALVNKKVIKDLKAQVGFLDVLEFPNLKEQYLVIFNHKGKLSLKPIKIAETEVKLCQVLSKRTQKGNKIQLGLSDGTTMLTQKADYVPGDSLVLALPERKIKNSLKMVKGATVYITGGKKVGTVGHLESITPNTSTQRGKITVKTENETFETIRDYAFVVGQDKPVISLE